MRARNGGERVALVRNVAHQRTAEDDDEPSAAPLRIPMPRPGDVLEPGDEPADGPYGPMVLLAYDQQLGALGVRLGRPAPRQPGEVLGARLAAAIGPATVYDGGPVREVILLLAELRPDGPPIPGLRPLADALVTVPVAADPVIVAEAVLRAWVFAGYVGWRPGQLESELVQGALVRSSEPLMTWLTRKTAR
jgi:putative transcriptional regulator